MTGANHGICAAIAKVFARRGCDVLCTFLPVDDPPDPRTLQAYRDHRGCDAGPVVAQIRSDCGWAVAVEADPADPAMPAMLFDAAEEQLGPVDINLSTKKTCKREFLEEIEHVVPSGALVQVDGSRSDCVQLLTGQ